LVKLVPSLGWLEMAGVGRRSAARSLPSTTAAPPLLLSLCLVGLGCQARARAGGHRGPRMLVGRVARVKLRVG
jgi:hypothetical protein